MSKRTKSITAGELISTLESNPIWVQREKQRQSKKKVLLDRLHQEQKPLLTALADIGFYIQSVWDLVNAKYNYDSAVPILLDHLQAPYSSIIREGIVRALTIKAARGLASDIMLREIKSPDCDPQLRWALANALTVVAERSDIETIKSYVDDEHFKDERLLLEKALKRLKAC